MDDDALMDGTLGIDDPGPWPRPCGRCDGQATESEAVECQECGRLLCCDCFCPYTEDRDICRDCCDCGPSPECEHYHDE